MRSVGSLPPTLSFLIALLTASSAAAQTSSERTMAEALFRQGRELMSQGKYAEACPKFAESQRQDPGGGTLLNLAVCHEKQGRLASAWGEFQEALAQAKADGRSDRVALAEERIQVLEPKLARITVRVVEPVSDLVVTVNGIPLGAAGWGTPMPVDAGSVELKAEAPQRKPFSKSVRIEDGQSLALAVPALEPLSETDTAIVEAAPAGAHPPDNTAVYVAGGLGLAALGLGSYFGVRAIQERRKADDHCDERFCTAEGEDADENAVFTGWLSTAGVGAGLLALGLAAYYYEAAPPTRHDSARRSPPPQLDFNLGPRRVGFDASWRF